MLLHPPGRLIHPATDPLIIEIGPLTRLRCNDLIALTLVELYCIDIIPTNI